MLYVVFNSEVTEQEVRNWASSVQALVEQFSDIRGFMMEPSAQAPFTGAHYAILSQAERFAEVLHQKEVSERVLYSASYLQPFLETEVKKVFGYSHMVFVKLKRDGDIKTLEIAAKVFSVQMLGNNPLMPRWYILSCTKDSVGDALQVANRLHESG